MRLSRFFAVASIAASLGAGAAHAVPVAPAPILEPTATGPFSIGDSVSVELSTVDGFPTFFGFEGDLSFDTALLSLIGITINPVLDFQVFDTTEPQPIDVAGGVLFNSDPSGAQILATFEFEALAEGSAEVAFEGIIINSDLESLFDGRLTSTLRVGEDTSSIPLPASLLLLLTGVSGLPLMRRVARRA